MVYQAYCKQPFMDPVQCVKPKVHQIHNFAVHLKNKYTTCIHLSLKYRKLLFCLG